MTTFEANPTTISAAGESVTLAWSVTGTDPALSISPEPGTVTGSSITVTPDATTTYTLNVTNNEGTSSRDVTVMFNENDDGEPTTPPEEQSLDLTGSWRITGSQSFMVNTEYDPTPCSLSWALELTQTDDALNGWYGQTEESATEDVGESCLVTDSLEGTVDAEGNITLSGAFIYNCDYYFVESCVEGIEFRFKASDAQSISGTYTTEQYENEPITFTRVDTTPDLDP